MRKVLIISDQEATSLRLLELYSALFANESKQLFLCTINIMECHQMDGIYYKTNQGNRASAMKVTTLPKIISYSKPYKSIHASSCSEIIRFIVKHKINLILIPHFIYDMQRSAQYLEIVKDIRRHRNMEIVGLYI